MPGQFGGEKATPVGVGRRVAGHLLWLVGLLVPALLAASGIFLGSEGIATTLRLVGMALGGVILVFGVIVALLWSTTIGGIFLGYRFIDSRTGRPNGPVMLVKFLVQAVFECVTLLLGTISYYPTYKDGQHWLDRVFNLVAVSKDMADQAEPVPQEMVTQPAPMAGPAMPQPAAAHEASPFGAPASRPTPESAFAPPAYGGPNPRSVAAKQQMTMPQSAAVGAGITGQGTPGFSMQPPPVFSAPEAPAPDVKPTGVPVYPPTADPVPPAPPSSAAASSPDQIAPASAPSPVSGSADPGWQRPTPAHRAAAEFLPDQSEPGAIPARAAEPVRPPSPFTPQPFPSPSPFPPPSPPRPAQPSVFQPSPNSWVATSASPVFPPVSPARATTVSPADPPPVRPVPPAPARAAKTPSLVQDATVADDGPEAIPEVVLDDGLRIEVDGPLVLGRNPLAPDAYPDARSVRVTDETMRLSKTHMVLRPISGRVQVIDVGATNGVYIEANRERTRIPAHEPWRLSEGDLVHFGGRTLRLVS
jgi:vegetative cell wall protein gp1